MAQSEKDFSRGSRHRSALDPRNPGAHRRNSSDSDREAFNAVGLPAPWTQECLLTTV